jgi:enamine deaminase RidA (YjgF/YER057c/UK114 family)
MTLASQRLAALGLELPPQRPPVGNFVTAMRHGDLLFLSGQGPVTADGAKFSGKVGAEVSEAEATEHARLVTLNLLAAAAAELGSIDRIDRIIKVLGFVNAAPDFARHPAVINGCSDLLNDVFGPERGRHARSAIGAGSLPGQITVEIEMIVSCKGAAE